MSLLTTTLICFVLGYIIGGTIGYFWNKHIESPNYGVNPHDPNSPAYFDVNKLIDLIKKERNEDI